MSSSSVIFFWSPAERAFSRSASTFSIASLSLVTMSSARADFSGSVRRHFSSSMPRIAVSTARIRSSRGRILSRGTLPIASQRSAISRMARFAASTSVTGTRVSASARSFSLASALAANSASCSAFAASRAPKNVSCAARNRPHSSSSTSRGAGPAAFHCRISSRYAPAVGPHSRDFASASASLASRSLTTRAPSRFSFCSAKCVFRRRVYAVRAVENRRHSWSSAAGRSAAAPSTRRAAAAAGWRRCASRCSRRASPPRRRAAPSRSWSPRPVRRVRPSDLPVLGDDREERVELADEAGEVADGTRLGHLFAEVTHGLGRLVGGHHTRIDPLLEQVDASGELVVPLGEEGERLLGRSFGVLADRTLPVRRAYVDRSVLGDASPLARRHWFPLRSLFGFPAGPRPPGQRRPC